MFSMAFLSCDPAHNNILIVHKYRFYFFYDEYKSLYAIDGYHNSAYYIEKKFLFGKKMFRKEFFPKNYASTK